MTDLDDRLRRIRGGGDAKRHNARTISALTTNPGCNRRAIMDAAGIYKERLADHIGFPAQFGQSRFALSRGQVFERLVKADGCAELLTQLRDVLQLELREVGYHDLNDAGGNEENGPRHAYTRSKLAGAVEGFDDGTLFDHPMLKLEVGGQQVYLEPDLIAFQWKGRLHVVEIKSFAVIDGRGDAEKVAAAAMQSAVYVLALRDLLAERGLPPSTVADRTVLVCPKDFSNRPAAHFVDVRKQMTVLRRQLSRITSIDALLSFLPPALCLSVERSPDEVMADLGQIHYRYMPECLNTCELARFCRDESRGATRALGREVAEELGGVGELATVLQLARETLPASPEQVEAAALLRSAWSLRQECLGSAA